jgi:ATP/maltotriose-dependent transcriptional regulator MalT/DNA-binding SARP family transcriptional activator
MLQPAEPTGMPSAKIAPPRLVQPLLRWRLFRLLDELRSNAIVWIVAPPGAGKTMLANSYLAERGYRQVWYQLDSGDADIAAFFHYLSQAIQLVDPATPTLPPLTPEYLAGLRIFARRYLEAMAGDGTSPAVWVLDNFEQLPEASPLVDLLVDLAADLPRNLALCVLSRVQPPAAFARLRLHGQLATLESSSLSLTVEEARQLCLGPGCAGSNRYDESWIQRLHALAAGWFAGFRLLMDHDLPPELPTSIEAPTFQLLFDYFGRELFDRFSKREQNILLRTAILPSATPNQACQLSEDAEAGAFLAELSRTGYFVVQRGESDPVYDYHPLFHGFLNQRLANSLNAEARAALQCRAAYMLAAEGKPDAAASLYLASGAWGELGELALREATGLVATGRYQTLARWLDAIPVDRLEQLPWLLYWTGIARMPTQPVQARTELEKAYALFSAQGEDVAGLYLTWSSIVETYLIEWRDCKPLDRWIDELFALRERHPDFPSPEIERRVATMKLSLMFREVHRLDLRQTLEECYPLLRETREPVARLQFAANLLLPALWLGEFDLARQIVAQVEDLEHGDGMPPFIATLWSVYVSAYFWNLGQPRRCTEIVSEALQVAEKTGMYAWNFLLQAHGVYGHLALGELEAAERHLAQLHRCMHCHTHLMGSHYYYLLARLKEAQGDFGGAVSAGRMALNMAEDAGTPVPQALIRLTLASILTHLNLLDEAQLHVQWAADLAHGMRSAMVDYLSLLTQANIDFVCGHRQGGYERLREALALSRAHGGIGMVFHWVPDQAALMYARALDAGIEVDHCREMIRRGGLLAPPEDLVPTAWPWPLRIFTLGRFSIVRDGFELRGAGKAQQKPLELLMALVSYRHSEVPKSILEDWLWPEMEGDGGYRALITTVHRLRQLLGHPDAIVAWDGHFSLNPRRVWVDCRSFEYALTHIGQLKDADGTLSAMGRLEQALATYEGSFLPSAQAPFTVATRERLRLLFREHSHRLATRYEQLGEEEKVMDCYLRGIAVDESAEANYRHLIELHLRHDRLAEARDVYLGYLQTSKMPPSPDLQSLGSRWFQDK